VTPEEAAEYERVKEQIGWHANGWDVLITALIVAGVIILAVLT